MRKKKSGGDDDNDEEPGAGGVLSQSELTDKISQEVFSKVVSQLQNVVTIHVDDRAGNGADDRANRCH